MIVGAFPFFANAGKGEDGEKKANPEDSRRQGERSAGRIPSVF
jgi:hypothetical protein